MVSTEFLTISFNLHITDSSKVVLSATENGHNEASHCKTWHDGEYPAFQKWFSSAEDPVLVRKMVRTVLLYTCMLHSPLLQNFDNYCLSFSLPSLYLMLFFNQTISVAD